MPFGKIHARERDEAGDSPQDVEFDLSLPGMKVTTTPTDVQFNGDRRQKLGSIIADEAGQ